LRILITAGPTREYIDPVRFISNSSTGYFGYQIASEALRRGHKVTLISGPTCLIPPKGARFIPVVSALDMKKAVEANLQGSDCLIMSAAVADYRPATVSSQKIKKDRNRLSLRLVKNPDILAAVAKNKGNRVVIGFAVETSGLEKNARGKLNGKKLDYILAASVNTGKSPFGDRKIPVLIIEKSGKAERVSDSKKNLSKIVLDKVISVKYPCNREKVQRERG